MTIYDLAFGTDPTSLTVHPSGRGPIAAPDGTPAPVLAGWSGGIAPGIGTEHWPHGAVHDLPMVHLLTLWLPAEYRRRGDDSLVAVSLFQADDHVADEAADPGHHVRHPRQVDLEDVIGGSFAAIWLTRTEYDARSEPPADPGTPRGPDGLNAWDHTATAVPVWLVERVGDPGAGQVPTEQHGAEVQRAFHGRSHLGGTALPVQALPEGLTPYYLELEDGVGGANFGGGNCQYDLENDTFDWAC